MCFESADSMGRLPRFPHPQATGAGPDGSEVQPSVDLFLGPLSDGDGDAAGGSSLGEDK